MLHTHDDIEIEYKHESLIADNHADYFNTPAKPFSRAQAPRCAMTQGCGRGACLDGRGVIHKRLGVDPQQGSGTQATKRV